MDLENLELAWNLKIITQGLELVWNFVEKHGHNMEFANIKRNCVLICIFSLTAMTFQNQTVLMI